MDKKKIVLVSKDAMGYFYLPAYGNSYYKNKTPNIDELAARGTVFNRHYTAAPSTAMAFIAMCTGNFPYQTQHRDYRVLTTSYKNTLFDKLWDLGYASHIIWDAKWMESAKAYSECYGEHTVFHLMEHLRQPIGAHYQHEGRLVENSELAERTLKDFEAEFQVAVHADEKAFIWVHFPHVIKGRIGYGADIDLFDRCVGIVRKYVEDDSIYLTADHGNMNGTKQKIGYGFDVYESAIRIPLITPRIDGLETYEGVTSNADFAHMILRGEIRKREFVYSDTAYYAQKHRKLAIIKGNYKYIYNKQTATEELYDVIYDSAENMNLVNLLYYDVDRKVEVPLEELYYYPYWDNSQAALKEFREEKERIWREAPLKEKLYYKLKHIFGRHN